MRLTRYGPNLLPQASGPTAVGLLLAQVRTPLMWSLRAQEAALTGESEPVDKGVEAVSQGASLAERTSLLYAGTTVAAGTGRGVAVATGPQTELGRISTTLDGSSRCRRRSPASWRDSAR